MSRFVTIKLRQAIGERANFQCEYCKLPELDTYYGFQADHIISWRHGGATELQNLAYACPDCNRNKGTDLGTFVEGTDDLIRFYNPRKDDWADHFELSDSGHISAQTNIGLATIKILEFNHPDRIIERSLLIRIGLLTSDR